MRKSSACLLLALLAGAILGSCSTMKKSGKVPFKPGPNFDKSTYVKPGNHIKAELYDADNYRHVVTDSSYTFPHFKTSLREVHSTVKYPRRARQNGIGGTVILKIYVDSTGNLSNVETAKSPHRLLSEASSRAAQQAKYKPATLEGKPVNSYAYFHFYFRTFVKSAR